MENAANCFGEPCLGFYSLTVASGTYLDTDPQCSCMCTWLSEGPHVRLGNWCHLPRKATLRLEAPGSEGPRVLLKLSICAPQSPSSQPKHELQSQVPPFLGLERLMCKSALQYCDGTAKIMARKEEGATGFCLLCFEPMVRQCITVGACGRSGWWNTA